jgi:bifunctional enzyme CysN/CysC
MRPTSTLLRFSTAGSVDDGKSTLIGRLLYDSKSLYADQLEMVARASQQSGEEALNLALITDGLKAEREQKITIDVAYRYFSTPRRKFIIADTPGHIQYTRNMVTGASTADLTIVLVDARKGLLTQSRRHAFIASLLQIPHLVVAVNKMDLVDYREDIFRGIVEDFNAFAAQLDIDDITYLPISALQGDNIVNKSEHMPWYQGATLMYLLENVQVDSRKNRVDFRFPVQCVIRPHQDFRGYAGTIASGAIRTGDEIVVLPGRQRSRIKEIGLYQQTLQEAGTGSAVTLRLEDEIDISRGDMIVRAQNLPEVSKEFEAIVCWMNDSPLEPNKTYLLQHTTRVVQALPIRLYYKIDVDTLHRAPAQALALNEIGRVRFTTAQPLCFDSYKTNNETGSFILIDPHSKVTLGAGMIRGIQTEESLSPQTSAETSQAVWQPWNIPRALREQRQGHKAKVLWFTGISGAGKSTLANALERKLWEQGKRTMLLDGDQLRHGLCSDLGFGEADRKENIRRVGEVARLFYEQGNLVLCTFVSPFLEDRQWVRALFPQGDFQEISVTCSSATAQQRDPKGLYAKALKGQIKGLTGFDAPHQANPQAELILDTEALTLEQCLAALEGLVSL